MVRNLFDGITAADVPDGWGVAGYIDGNWPDFHALTLRWPNAEHISIAAHPADRAKALDVETGDATPADAPGWVLDQRAAGDPYPWVYMNEETWPEVIFEFASQHVAVPLWWVARYDGVAVLPPNAIAKQHTNTAGYDISVVADFVPGIDPEPKPPTPPIPPEDTMKLYTAPDSGAPDAPKAIYAFGNGKYEHVADPNIYADLLGLGWENGGEINYPTHAFLLATYGTAVAA